MRELRAKKPVDIPPHPLNMSMTSMGPLSWDSPSMLLSTIETAQRAPRARAEDLSTIRSRSGTSQQESIVP